jgi:uncharacterized protein
MKIVLDTNVLVSGLLTPHGYPAGIVDLIMFGEVTLIWDARILEECREVLRRPRFRFQKRDIDLILDMIMTAGEAVISKPLKIELPDRDDRMFVEVAIAAEAKYIVPGNLKDFPKRKYGGARVISSREMMEIFLQGSSAK